MMDRTDIFGRTISLRQRMLLIESFQEHIALVEYQMSLNRNKCLSIDEDNRI